MRQSSRCIDFYCQVSSEADNANEHILIKHIYEFCRYGAGIVVGTALVTLLKRTALPLGAKVLSPCIPFRDNRFIHAPMENIIVMRTVIISKKPR